MEDVDENMSKVAMPRTIFNEIVSEVSSKKQLVEQPKKLSQLITSVPLVKTPAVQYDRYHT